MKRGFTSSYPRHGDLIVPLDGLANMLLSLALEVSEVMDLGGMLLDDRQHLVFTVAFQFPSAVIPNIFAMKVLLLLAHLDPRFQEGWMQIAVWLQDELSKGNNILDTSARSAGNYCMSDLQAGLEKESAVESRVPANSLAEPQPIEQGRSEGLAMGLLSMLLSLSFPIFWVRVIVLLLCAVMLRYILWHSHWSFRWHRSVKYSCCAVGIVLFGCLGVYSFREMQRTKLQVTFLEPQFLSYWKRLEITRLLRSYHDRLSELGIPVSLSAPSIGALPIHPGTVSEEDTIMYATGDQPWRRFIKIAPRATIHASAVGEVYISMVVAEGLGPHHSSSAAAIADDFASYLSCSFSGDSARCKSGLSHALWQVREAFGASFTDYVVADAFQGLRTKESGTGTSAFSAYTVIGQGCYGKWSDDGARCKEVSAILEKNGVRQP